MGTSVEDWVVGCLMLGDSPTDLVDALKLVCMFNNFSDLKQAACLFMLKEKQRELLK